MNAGNGSSSPSKAAVLAGASALFAVILALKLIVTTPGYLERLLKFRQIQLRI